jgi:hypothetical protein
LLDDLDRYLLPRSRGAVRHGLGALRARVKSREKDGLRAVERAVPQGVRLARKVCRSARSAGNDGQIRKGPRARPSRLHHLVREEVWHLYDAVLAYDARSPTDFDVLHKFRSACRRLRYALELFQNDLPGLAPLARELRNAQDELGTLHDHVVAAACIRDWLTRGKVDANAAIDDYLRSHEVARDELHQRGRTTWEAILGSAFRTRLALALEGRLRPAAAAGA